MSVRGKHAIVSGGGTGVGAATAQALVRAGASVTIMGRTESALEDQQLPYQVCDVTDAAAVATAVEAAVSQRGPVHIAVANAGAAESVPFAKMSAQTLQSMFDVNVFGVVNLWQAALPHMLAESHGRLIAIASTAGLKGYPYVSAYCAAKHGVVGLTRSVAVELARSGVTTNAVCPGFVDTPLLSRSISNIIDKTGMSENEAAKSLLKTNPQQRFIDPDEVAESVVWLCGESARSINGHTLTLSGGEI